MVSRKTLEAKVDEAYANGVNHGRWSAKQQMILHFTHVTRGLQIAVQALEDMERVNKEGSQPL